MTRYRITIELDLDYDAEPSGDFLKALKEQFSACLDEGVTSSYCDDALEFDTYDLRVEIVDSYHEAECRHAEKHALPPVAALDCALGTWLQPEAFAGPRNAYGRKGRALWPDGVLRMVMAKLPDTAMSIPAYYTSKGRRVHGYLTYTDGVYRFHE